MTRWQNLGLDFILRLINRLNSRSKNAIKMAIDAIIVIFSQLCSIYLKTEIFFSLNLIDIFTIFSLVVCPTFLTLYYLGLYRNSTRYASTETVILIAFGTVFSVVNLLFVQSTLVSSVPRTVPIIYGLVLFIMMCGTRFAWRMIFSLSNSTKTKNLAIYGAGRAVVQILKALKTDSNYRARMIIDDDPDLRGQRLLGLPISSFEDALKLFDKNNIETILIAIPSASLSDRQRVISNVSNLGLSVKTIPSIDELIDGSAEVTEFQDIAVEDLLGREQVEPIPSLVSKHITNCVVLVTGAGGTIGSELCRQILKKRPKMLLLLDVSEFAIYTISRELERQVNDLGVILCPVVGSVQDQPLMKRIFANYNIDTVYHAAAYKHVPLMEQNIIEAIKNNTLGTLSIAEEAVTSNVSSFTLISTDKAVNPTNIMGASKRLAERICQNVGQKQSTTCFSIVRFGNVLGSSGSVVPLFKQQIEAGGPITLTHSDITRYFMTVSEAALLVLQASALAKGEDLFVLDMGKPVKIKDLAFKMVRLSGLAPYLDTGSGSPQGDIAIKVSGLRPGEKMYEEMSYGTNFIRTEHPRILTVNENNLDSTEVDEIISKLNEHIADSDLIALENTLIESADYRKCGL